MLTAVRGYYDGTKIVLSDEVPMSPGQELMITFLAPEKERRAKPDLRKYMGRGAKMFPDTDPADYVRKLRENDRI